MASWTNLYLKQMNNTCSTIYPVHYIAPVTARFVHTRYRVNVTAVTTVYKWKGMEMINKTQSW